jgi:hypothetical protein
MAYTSIPQGLIDGVPVPRSFGQYTKDDLDDHESRLTTNAAAIATINSNLGTWSGGTAISRIAALESNNAIGGEWLISGSLAIGTPTLINNWVARSGITPNGVSHSAGVFTSTFNFVYTIAFGWRGSTATADTYAYIAGTGATGDVWFKNSQSGAANVGTSGSRRVGAGGNIRLYAYAGSAKNAVMETVGDSVTGVTIYKIAG